MIGYEKINLLDLLDELGEQELRENLGKFSCPYNFDVEDFIHNKAITFAQQGLAAVWIVLASYKSQPVPVGYFALANKSIHIAPKKLSSNLRKRISKFSIFNGDIGKFILSSPLIGQLGKNYAYGFDKLIRGDDLLTIACNTVREGQRIFGGRTVYLECENVPALVEFYKRNGFSVFGARSLDREEEITLKCKLLIQLIKYLN